MTAKVVSLVLVPPHHESPSFFASSRFRNPRDRGVLFSRRVTLAPVGMPCATDSTALFSRLTDFPIASVNPQSTENPEAKTQKQHNQPP